MIIDNALWIDFAVALGAGLLIGAERERSKGTGPDRAAAGIRTFSIASLLGAISIMVNFWLLVASLLCVTIFAAAAYYRKRDDDPGLTTEIALVFTVIVGGIATSAPSLAAGLAVSTAILLAAKEPIHGFVRGVLTKAELNDLLILAAAALIVMPLVPNRFMGPFAAINPRNLWLIVIMFMSISALGHIGLRWLGGRIGLPVVGLISGFVSSIATIGAMGARARKTPELMSSTVAGAMLSNLATILQLALLLAAIHVPTLRLLALPLLFGGVSVAIYCLFVTLQSLREKSSEFNNPSQSVSIKAALMLAGIIGCVLIATAALKTWFGQAGLVAASAIAGLADAHSSAISVASLVGAGKLQLQAAAIPILVAFSVNAVSKAVMAVVSGGQAFALRVIPGLLLQVSAIWAGWWLF